VLCVFDPAHPLPVERFSTDSTLGCNSVTVVAVVQLQRLLLLLATGFVSGPLQE
jgi:hypothetical protein